MPTLCCRTQLITNRPEAEVRGEVEPAALRSPCAMTDLPAKGEPTPEMSAQLCKAIIGDRRATGADQSRRLADDECDQEVGTLPVQAHTARVHSPHRPVRRQHQPATSRCTSESSPALQWLRTRRQRADSAATMATPFVSLLFNVATPRRAKLPSSSTLNTETCETVPFASITAAIPA